MTDVRGKGLARLYITGGTELLATRLVHLFTRIDNDEQRVLHNHVLAEVLELINTKPAGEYLSQAETGFLKNIAGYLLYKQLDGKQEKELKVNQEEELFLRSRKRFLFRMAGHILHLAGMKGQ